MTLVKRTFILFLAAFLLQMTLLLGLIYFGYTHSEGQWKSMRIAAIQDSAKTVLVSGAQVTLPQDVPISVYDAMGNLIATNRGVGRGRTLQENELVPIKDSGKVIGYYSAGQLSFRSDSASRELIETMTTVLAAGLLLSLGISLAAAAYFSRQVSRPAQRISASLEEMTRGDRIAKAPETGVEEVAAIARSVNTLQDRLQQEQVIRSQWAQDIAHDLRTPVSSMKAQFEAMIDGIFPADTDRIQKLSRELLRMEILIRDLEMLMKLESPEMQITKKSVNAHDFLQDILSGFHNIHIPDTIENFQFSADDQLLYRALSNLITNALRHGEPGTAVSLSITRDESTVMLCVHNYGTPIPQQEIRQVFDRLFRGEYARKTPGSGLGLTIVKRIAELHEGTVEITSTAEAGTKAVIHIPN